MELMSFLGCMTFVGIVLTILFRIAYDSQHH